MSATRTTRAHGDARCRGPDPDEFRRTIPRLRGEALGANPRTVAARHAATPVQVAPAWLSARRDMVLPIPGTRRPRPSAPRFGNAADSNWPHRLAPVRSPPPPVENRRRWRQRAAERRVRGPVSHARPPGRAERPEAAGFVGPGDPSPRPDRAITAGTRPTGGSLVPTLRLVRSGPPAPPGPGARARLRRGLSHPGAPAARRAGATPRPRPAQGSRAAWARADPGPQRRGRPAAARPPPASAGGSPCRDLPARPGAAPVRRRWRAANGP